MGSNLARCSNFNDIEPARHRARQHRGRRHRAPVKVNPALDRAARLIRIVPGRAAAVRIRAAAVRELVAPGRTRSPQVAELMCNFPKISAKYSRAVGRSIRLSIRGLPGAVITCEYLVPAPAARPANTCARGPLLSCQIEYLKTAENCQIPANRQPPPPPKHKVHVSLKQYRVKMNWLFYVITLI